MSVGPLAGEFAPVLMGPGARAEGASGPMSAGAIAAQVRASLAAIECAR